MSRGGEQQEQLNQLLPLVRQQLNQLPPLVEQRLKLRRIQWVHIAIPRMDMAILARNPSAMCIFYVERNLSVALLL